MSTAEIRAGATTAAEILTAQGLADYLEVPLSTVYDWRHKGTGPRGFRAGKHLRYRRADVAEWIDQQANAA